MMLGDITAFDGMSMEWADIVPGKYMVSGRLAKSPPEFGSYAFRPA